MMHTINSHRAGLCAALFLLVAVCATHPAMAVWVTKADNATIVVDDVIKPGDADAISAAIHKSTTRPIVVIFDTPGGNLVEALRIGQLLREEGAVTVVPATGECLSACFYAFAGGVHRLVERGGRLGVHQFSYPAAEYGKINDAVREAQEQISEISMHLIAAGISPLVGALAGSVPPDEMLFFAHDELAEMSIVTGDYDADGDAASKLPETRSAASRPVERTDGIDWCSVPVFMPDGTLRAPSPACRR